jgi:hypothetical protein
MVTFTVQPLGAEPPDKHRGLDEGFPNGPGTSEQSSYRDADPWASLAMLKSDTVKGGFRTLQQ